MKELKQILTNGFFILVIYLVIITAVIAVNEMNNVSADTPASSNNELVVPADSSAVGRDITQQRFAPLEANQ